MARRYVRDARGRFASGGGSSGRRQLRSKAGTSAASPRLERKPVSGTAKPSGTISGTRYGRSVDQFSREMQSMAGRKIGAKVKQRPSTLKERAKQAGLKTSTKRTHAPRTMRDATFTTSAPRGTIPKANPSGAVMRSDGERRTLSAANSTRRPIRSAATAAKATAAEGMLTRGETRRLKRKRR
jgi:hypothetical protein